MSNQNKDYPNIPRATYADPNRWLRHKNYYTTVGRLLERIDQAYKNKEVGYRRY